MVMPKVTEFITQKLESVHDYKNISFLRNESNDDRLLFRAENFMGQEAFIKVELDDEQSIYDWSVYEQVVNEYTWEPQGTVSELE